MRNLLKYIKKAVARMVNGRYTIYMNGIENSIERKENEMVCKD